MKISLSIFGLLVVLSSTARAQSPVTLTIATDTRGYEVPPDFAGVSIFTGTQVHDHRNIPGNLFSGSNTQLINLFKNTGLHHLRLGATGSPGSGIENLHHEDIDALFAFAQATDLHVIYSLHYAGGPETAKYIWDHYQPWLDCFAFDNEPDGRLNENTGHKDYFGTWMDFAQSITNAVPGARLAGPDAAGGTLSRRFVRKEKSVKNLALITQHFYFGGNPRKRGIDTPLAIKNMLSRDWSSVKYPNLYRTRTRGEEKASVSIDRI